MNKPRNDVWKSSTKKITILNPQDFEVPEFIKEIKSKFNLSDDVFGSADEKEVKERLEVMKVLKNEGIMEAIDDLSKFFQKSIYLPSSENDFLFYYDQNDNPYWKAVKSLIKKLKPFREYTRIDEICSYLESKLHLEEVEMKFASEISHKLKSVTFLEGIIKMEMRGDDYWRYHSMDDLVNTSVVVGKKAYRSTWKDGFVANVPNWTKSPLMRFLGVKSFVQKMANSFAIARANSSSTVSYLPRCVVQDILNHFNKEEFNSLRNEYRNCIFTLHFLYDEHGLRIDFIGVEKEVGDHEFSFQKRNFDGFTKRERKQFKKSEKEVTNLYIRSKMLNGLQTIYDELNTEYSLFTKYFKIESKNTDDEFRWYALNNIYNENKELVEKLEDIRRYTSLNVKTMSALGSIIKYMTKIAAEKNLNICIPEITEAHTGTTFNDLAPIEIFEKHKKLISFTLPTINGHILCLTGRHGGGKSVAGKSILSSVWMAQSGLPIFAKEFKTEIKTVIGSIVNDNGEGSTATVFVEKVKSLMEGISKVPNGESIIFIDEIGKGTQETAGINLGKRILKTVKDKGYSVIFNSQILALAEYAKDELGANCFVVDKNHQFKEGIGDGQMDELLKEKGLDKYLN